MSISTVFFKSKLIDYWEKTLDATNKYNLRMTLVNDILDSWNSQGIVAVTWSVRRSVGRHRSAGGGTARRRVESTIGADRSARIGTSRTGRTSRTRWVVAGGSARSGRIETARRTARPARAARATGWEVTDPEFMSLHIKPWLSIQEETLLFGERRFGPRFEQCFNQSSPTHQLHPHEHPCF